MSTTTTNLGLFKYTEADYDQTFNFNLALNNNWDTLDSSVMKSDIITLTGTTPSLTNNRIHKITCSGNTTFTLPSASINNFNQMVILLYMPSVYTIYLKQDGLTISYFNEIEPDMSTVGYYTIIYEYDNIKNEWVVGVLKKA